MTDKKKKSDKSKKKKSGKSKKRNTSESVKKVASKTSREIVVKYKEEPKKKTEGIIGPRPALPSIPKGKKTEDITPSPPIRIDK